MLEYSILSVVFLKSVGQHFERCLFSLTLSDMCTFISPSWLSTCCQINPLISPLERKQKCVFPKCRNIPSNQYLGAVLFVPPHSGQSIGFKNVTCSGNNFCGVSLLKSSAEWKRKIKHWVTLYLSVKTFSPVCKQ